MEEGRGGVERVRKPITKGADFPAAREEEDGVVEDSNSDGALSPAPSSVSDHMLERKQIHPNRWVGEIVNFFRYSKVTGQMNTDVVEYILTPDGSVSPTNGPQLRLSMRDIWRAGGGDGDDQDAGAATACVWDWKSLKVYVERARRDYAFNRKKDLARVLCGD